MSSGFRKMDKKDEESSSSGNPYKNIEKASVLQEVFLIFVEKFK
jgi:putative IMPACT (imprinted ancient) family translation regulator